MDKRRAFEMPVEQRMLLNAGHGPPPIPPGNSMASGISNPIGSSATSWFHRNNTCDDLGSRLALSAGFSENGRYQQIGLNQPEIDERPVLLQIIKEKDQQLQQLKYEVHLMQTNTGQKLIGDLVRDNDELQRQVITITKELVSLRTKYQQLTKELASMPDVTVRLPPYARAPDDYIDLVASGEGACRHHMANKELNSDDDVSMTRSVQCSEPSMEPVVAGKLETKEMEIASPISQKNGGGISPSSSSSSSESFEVVGQGSCLESPAEREDVGMTSMNLKAKVDALQSEVSELSRKLEAVEEERKRETAELKARLDQICRLEAEKINGKTSEVTDRQTENQRQNLSELRSANWKLTEQNVELTRENEDLRRKERDLRSIVHQLEEELESKRQRIQELEARIQDVEHVRWAESSEQKGMALSGSASELATENSLLKHQIEAYKEDFEVERKDREKLIAQKDTLQRSYDILRSDLDVAREQLKKFESDITLLRVDNSTLRTKLRSVTEEVETFTEVRQPMTLTAKPVLPPAQKSPLMPQPMPHNTIAPLKPSPPPTSGPSGDWECQACTFKNPAPRTFCEMCGTHEPLRMPSAAQAPHRTYVPNIPVRELPPVQQWNMGHSATPLLSNLRNYGDIETD